MSIGTRVQNSLKIRLKEVWEALNKDKSNN